MARTSILVVACLALGLALAAAQSCSSMNDCTNQICSAGQCVDCSSLVAGCSQCQDGNSTDTALCMSCGSGFDSNPLNGSCMALTNSTGSNSTGNNSTGLGAGNNSNSSSGSNSSTVVPPSMCDFGFFSWNMTNDTACHACDEQGSGIAGCASCAGTSDGEFTCHECMLGYSFKASTNSTGGQCIDCQVSDQLCLQCQWVPAPASNQTVQNTTVVQNSTNVNTTDANSTDANQTQQVNQTQQNTTTIVSNASAANGTWQCLECPWPVSFLHPNGHCVVIYAFDSFAQSVEVVNGTYNLTCVPGYFTWRVNGTDAQYCVACSEFDQQAATCEWYDGEYYTTSCYDGFYFDNATQRCEWCNIENAASCMWQANASQIVATSCLDGFYLYNNTCYACNIAHAISCEWRDAAWYDGELAFWNPANSASANNYENFFDTPAFLADGENLGANSTLANSSSSSSSQQQNQTVTNTTTVVQNTTSQNQTGDNSTSQNQTSQNTTTVVQNQTSNSSGSQSAIPNGGYLRIKECAWGYYKWNNTCVPCTGVFANCSFCAWAAAASNSSSSNSTKNISDLACIECRAGFYWDAANNTCLSCGTNSSAKSCIQSPANASLLIITSCFDGFYLNAGQCVPCGGNCSVCYGNVQQTAAACLKCLPGFYVGIDNQCHECPMFANDGEWDFSFGYMNGTLAQNAWLNATGQNWWQAGADHWSAPDNATAGNSSLHSNYFNDEMFENRFYSENGHHFTDGEHWDGEARDAFFNHYTRNGTYNYIDGVHPNLTINAYTNWAVINATRLTLWRITSQRAFNSCSISNMKPVCFACNETLIVPFPLHNGQQNATKNSTGTQLNTTTISNTTSGATDTNATDTNTTVTQTNTTDNGTSTNTTQTNTTVTNTTDNGTNTNTGGSNTSSGSACSNSVNFCSACTITGSTVACTQCQDGYYLKSDRTCQPCTQLFPNCAVCSTAADFSVSCNSCFFGYSLNGQTCAQNNPNNSNDSSVLAFSLAILALLQVFITLM